MSDQRSLLLFENSIKSEATREKYLYYLSKFKDFYKLRDYDSILQIPTEKLQEMVEDYVMDLKKRVNPNTIPTPMYAIQSFLEANDVELKWKKIKKLYPAKVKKSGGKAWTTKDIQKMLGQTSELRTKSLVHLLAASGIRIGGAAELELKHLTKMPEDCYAILIYEDSTEEYTTFLTPEASKALDEYLDRRRRDGEYLGPNSPVFRVKYRIGIEKVRPMSQKAMEAVFSKLIHKAGLRTNKKGYRYDRQADHGFRKRWNTIMKTTEGVKISLAEKMFGHSFTIPLDETYLDPTLEKLFENYKKAIPELTIDEAERLRIKNEKLVKEKSEVKKLEKRIEELEYGKKPREAEFLKRLLEVKDQPGKSVLETILYLWFEIRATEDEKREIWEKIQQANKKGEKLNLTKLFGESRNLAIKNYYSDITS